MTTTHSFEVGATYKGQFVTDADSTFTRTVTKRTAKFVWLTNGREVKKFGVRVWDGRECCEPFGRYSMSPGLYADKRVA